jgi:hypothetical protein
MARKKSVRSQHYEATQKTSAGYGRRVVRRTAYQTSSLGLFFKRFGH